MGILNLLKKPFKKGPQNQSYLSLILTCQDILASIWTFDGEEVHIIGKSQKKIPQSPGFIHEAAIAIDQAARSAASDPQKTVFGLSHYWLENDKPTAETLKILKDLSEDLELEAQAYVSIASAVNHLIKLEEGVTPQAILVGVFANFCEVHKLAAGIVQKSQTISAQITKERVTNLLGLLKEEESLPARVIIFGSAKTLIDDIKTEKWPNLFISVPKITVLSDDDLFRAVAYAQARDILGYDQNQPLEREAEKPEQEKNLGFVEDEDILQKEKEEETSTQIQQDLTAQETSGDDKNTKAEQNFEFIPSPEPVFQAVEPTDFVYKPKKLQNLRFLTRKNFVIALAAIILIFLVGIYMAARFLTNAEVSVKVSAKNQDFDFNVRAPLGGSYDIGALQINGKSQTGFASGSQKSVATGSKKIGEKAKGSVKVFNFDTGGTKKFPAQTQIITKDGLKFAFDSEVEVPPRVGSTSGQAKVNATATDVGNTYNIAQGTSFTIVGFDEILYYAESDSAFAGGDEKQITVVSSGDLERLEKSLTSSLDEKARADLKNKTANLKIYDEAITIKITKKDFDKKLNEEATLINLDMELEAGTVAIDENDLKRIIADSVNLKSNDLFARPDDIKIPQPRVGSQKDTLQISGKAQISLLSKFNEEDIKAKIAGKSIKEARSIIKNIPEVTDIQFKFSPNLPLVDNLPNKNKIKLKIEVGS